MNEPQTDEAPVQTGNEKNNEVLELTAQILSDFEYGELPLANIFSKALRLARITNNTKAIQWLRSELSGYGLSGQGVPPEEWKLGAISFRHYSVKEQKSEKLKTFMYTQSIGQIEAEIDSAKAQLAVSTDPNVSISSSNPNQYVNPSSNSFQRSQLKTDIVKWTGVKDRVKSAVYTYVLNVHYEYKFGNISESIFEERRRFVDIKLRELSPDALQEVVSAYDNLRSSNEKDWANVGTSIRRMLKAVADTLSPAQKPKKSDKAVLTEDAYINRLINYIEGKSQSESFQSIVGSHLKYIGERLDALNGSGSKGTHHKLTKDEAKRLLIYTYLTIGDILQL
ncbi:hypothetical protein H3C66_01840 [Patescibacteria group bacterium]|nr:hypothetical protein [Patescibacteria group bacterium]